MIVSNSKIMELDCNGSSLLIECINPSLDSDSGTKPSSFASEVIDKLPKDIFTEIGLLAKGASEKFKSKLGTSDKLPSEVELEFSFAVTTTGKLMVLSTEAEFGIKMKLTWKNSQN